MINVCRRIFRSRLQGNNRCFNALAQFFEVFCKIFTKVFCMIDEIELFTRLRHVSGNIQITFYSSKVNSLEHIFFIDKLLIFRWSWNFLRVTVAHFFAKVSKLPQNALDQLLNHILDIVMALTDQNSQQFCVTLYQQFSGFRRTLRIFPSGHFRCQKVEQAGLFSQFLFFHALHCRLVSGSLNKSFYGRVLKYL